MNTIVEEKELAELTVHRDSLKNILRNIIKDTEIEIEELKLELEHVLDSERADYLMDMMNAVKRYHEENLQGKV